ncbi:MAG: type II CAAX endopeptidase family protein [Gammaproteobacteria bacterium]
MVYGLRMVRLEDSEQPPAPGGRRRNGVELAVFLFLIVPSMLLSFTVTRGGGMDFVTAALATIVRDLGLVGLIAYFLWRNGEAFECLGWIRRGAGREIVLGAILFVPLFLGTGWLARLLQSVGLSGPPAAIPAFLQAHGLLQMLLALALVSVVAVAEETIFRGYLILRLRMLGLERLSAAVVSSLLFSLGHGYEGSAGVITVGVMGLAFAWVYLWRGSLIAPIVMHFLQDLVGLVILPALGGH